jgi:hypothetical protein
MKINYLDDFTFESKEGKKCYVIVCSWRNDYRKENCCHAGEIFVSAEMYEKITKKFKPGTHIDGEIGWTGKGNSFTALYL